jgi:alpha-tubulin suppressor-like RCC1 family protein
MKTYKVITLTTVGSGTWTVPHDWNNSENEIHMIGGGGGALGDGGGLGRGYGGGGGGAYGYIKNYQTTANAQINYTVGAGGTPGYISSGTPGGNTIFASYYVGGGGVPSLGSYQNVGLGGSYFSGQFTLTRTGGNGGQGEGSSSSHIGGGGGGAGGFNGNGISGNTYTSSTGYQADKVNGGAGDGGFGGSVGSQYTSRTPSLAQISIGILNRLVGSGGGGAGSYTATYFRSGSGGLYGGGGGGFGTNPGNPPDYGNGAQGVIVIFYAVEDYFPEPGYYSVTDNFNRFFIKEQELIERFIGKKLWAWGDNSFGNLGTNNTSNYSSPITTVAGETNWKQVSCGTWGTKAIKTDGTLWVWGQNTYGQLGDNTTISKLSPVTTTGTNSTNWKYVSSGYSHTAAIKTDGTLWVWGRNSVGELGTNNTSNYSSPITTVAGGTNWKQVSCGEENTAAIKTDGTLWVWGWNDSGKLGTNNTTNYSSPVTTVAGGTNWETVSCGATFTAAIKADGTLWTWGRNLVGQLGVGTTTSSIVSPVTTVAGGTNWKQVSAGNFHAAAIKTDGTLWIWGANGSGQLGTNNTTSYSSPVTTIAGGTNWKQVSTSNYFNSAIKTDGTLWVWGQNDFGQLGTNNTTNYSSPTTTLGGGTTNWKTVSCGTSHTAAIGE